MAELKAQSDSLLNAYKLIPTTTQAFENGFRAIVSNTNAIAQNSQQVADWADNVIGAVGVAGKMDNIRYKINQTTKQALITEQDYAAAQAAYTPIMEANQRIQDATLAIQVKQAPVLADLANQQAVYMEQLAGMPAQQQLVQLGFMDNALSAQAMQLQMFALSGASQQAMDEVIGGAARADPVLRAMLESMGLISVGADGTITVTVGGQSELDQLTSSIEQLITTEWIAMFNGDATKAEAAYEHATGLMVDWDGSEGTGTANLQDNASATLNNISSLLDSINGRVATNYVNTVYQVSGAGPVGAGFLASGALGGVFDGYADGGVVAEMNEYGLERLSFPGGGTGYTSGRRGLHRVPKGTLVTPASHVRAEGGTQPINVNIHVGGSIVGISDISQAVSRDIIPAIIQATNEWRERFPS